MDGDGDIAHLEDLAGSIPPREGTITLSSARPHWALRSFFLWNGEPSPPEDVFEAAWMVVEGG